MLLDRKSLSSCAKFMQGKLELYTMKKWTCAVVRHKNKINKYKENEKIKTNKICSIIQTDTLPAYAWMQYECGFNILTHSVALLDYVQRRDRHQAGPPGPAILKTRFSEPGDFQPGSGPEVSKPGFCSPGVSSPEPGPARNFLNFFFLF